VAPGRVGELPAARDVLKELENVHRTLITTHLEKSLKSERVLRDLRRQCNASAFVTLQDLILKLSAYWASHGCLIQQPLDLEVGAVLPTPRRSSVSSVLAPGAWRTSSRRGA